MEKFELATKTRMKLVKVTARKELHGDSRVQAISLRVRWETTNDMLALLHPNLLDRMYYRAPSLEAQEEIDGVPQTKPNLRVPGLNTDKPENKYVGWKTVIDYGMGGDSDITLNTCTLDKFEVDCKEGGTSYIEWSIASNSSITKEMVGDLCDLEGGEIEALVLAPEVSDTPVIDGTKGHPGAAAQRAAEENGQQRLDAPSEGGDGEAPDDDVDGEGDDDTATAEFIKRNTTPAA